MSGFARETIVALSTAPGRGAIAIVRLSGAKSLPILTGIFKPRKKRDVFPAGRPVLGRFVDEGQAFDEGLALYHQAPDSVTGEDVVEMHCHGGPAIVGTILRLAREMGARPAAEGEFTRRAFLEGKIDLVQAEAVADLVAAQTEKAARAALHHLEGRLSKDLEVVWEKVVEAGAHIEAAIDFPDEFEPGAGPSVSGAPMGSAELASLFAEIETALERLVESYRSGRILREGARAAILGRPNAGKSTLLNALLGADRAITSEVPGTTRDTVEEVCDFGGAPVRLIDTAGLRDTGDPVELEGTERARKAAGEADVGLMVMDLTAGDDEIRWAAREARALDCQNLFVFNKMDKSTHDMKARALRAFERVGAGRERAALHLGAHGRGVDEVARGGGACFDGRGGAFGRGIRPHAGTPPRPDREVSRSRAKRPGGSRGRAFPRTGGGSPERSAGGAGGTPGPGLRRSAFGQDFFHVLHRKMKIMKCRRKKTLNLDM